jgi:hypothetical protein
MMVSLDVPPIPDQDRDGVGDPQDNCLVVANADQRDTDLDGYGNLCDGDFDGDGAVSAGDFATLKQGYLVEQGDSARSPDIDLDGDGIVTGADFSRFRPLYLAPPGPSGLACAGAPPCPDQDRDGVGDPHDNCLVVANPDQRDSDLDGYGNLCDGDFDGDGVVSAADFATFKEGYLREQGDPGGSPDVDLDGDGIVTGTDLSRFHPLYLKPSGPSGLACAGTPPCP